MNNLLSFLRYTLYITQQYFNVSRCPHNIDSYIFTNFSLS